MCPFYRIVSTREGPRPDQTRPDQQQQSKLPPQHKSKPANVLSASKQEELPVPKRTESLAWGDFQE